MIRVLEKHVADKIAAGEVVERPLSVVKELVENAVDAGASSITIEIKNGGKSYIRVTDNGSGIHQDEVLLAFMRHATSKIATDADLLEIHTLGFRGEALASIAAVSRVELLTKQAASKLGKRVSIAGGTILENIETGCPDGTTIVVTDLFFNTPARLKFLKSDKAESSVIIDFLSQMTLAYPEIRIRFINNGNILFATNGKGDVHNNILTVYSREIADSLVPVHFVQEEISVSGYISSPSVSNTTRRNQIFFVNGRIVNSRVIEKGVSDAYSDRLFAGRHPSAFLFLEIAPNKLDVNIHPNKKEVKFDNNALVTAVVKSAVTEALTTKEAIPQVKEKNIFRMKENSDYYTMPLSKQESQEVFFNKESVEAEKNTERETVQEVKAATPQLDIKSLLSTMRAEEIKKEEKKAAVQQFEKTEKGAAPAIFASIKTPAVKPFDFSELCVIGSVFSTYILLSDTESLYLIDQHAAHERVFFEKLLAEYEQEEKVKQPILIPLILNLPYGVKENAGESLKQLETFGFEIEEFGPKTYAVKAIPMFMSLSEAEDFLHYFTENVSDDSMIYDQNKLEKLMMSACKAAVKGGDLLQREEIEALLAELSSCKNPFSCPHGRPTFLRMKKYEIEKMFKRV